MATRYFHKLSGLVLVALIGPCVWADDADLLGRQSGYPVGTRFSWAQEKFLVGSFSNWDKVLITKEVSSSGSPLDLKVSATPGIDPEIFTKLGLRSLDDYMRANRVMGLMILRDGVVLVERYQYQRTPNHRFVSHSMAKGLVALTTGAALADGYIQSIEDPVEKYLPEMKGSDYGSRSLRSLLQMSSGMHGGDYDPRGGAGFIKPAASDIPSNTPYGSSVMRVLKEVSLADRRFSYYSGDTYVLTLVIAAAVKQSFEKYFSARIWQKIGAESDASWATDAGGNPFGFSGFSARLRDYARVGLLMANGGELNGSQIIPRDWILEMTRQNEKYPHLAPRVATPSLGYGYFTWLFPNRPWFSFQGVHGQIIFVDPIKKLVVVQTSAWKTPSDKERNQQRLEFLRAIASK